MGIASSSDNRIKQVRSCIVGDVWDYSVVNSGLEVLKKECEALFGPKVEEKFMDTETETYERIADLLREGPCKESYKGHVDCVDENGYGSNKCGEAAVKMYNCWCSHPDYYQPMLAVFKSVEEHVLKESDAYLAKKQALRDDALTARNQVFRDEFRRFR